MFCVRLIVRFLFWLKMSFLYIPNCFLKFSFDRCGETENWFCKNRMHEWKIYRASGTADYTIIRCCRCNESYPNEYDAKFNLISAFGVLFWLISSPIWVPLMIWSFFLSFCKIFEDRD